MGGTAAYHVVPEAEAISASGLIFLAFSRRYIYDEADCGGDSFCVWQNYYDAETRLCDFSLTVFEKEEGSELYSRRDETQTERCYSKDEIIAALEKNGFELIGMYSDFNFTPANDTDERWYIVARAKKD